MDCEDPAFQYLPQCAIGNWFESQVGDAITNMADAVLEAFAQTVASLGTVWVNIGTPNLMATGSASSVDPGSAADVEGITQVLGSVTWISLATAVVALFILGAMIATRTRAGEGFASVGKIGLILTAVVLISAAGAIVGALLPDRPQGVTGTVAFLQSSLWWYMGAAVVLSVIVGAVRMVWEQRAEPGRDLLRSLFTLIVVAGAGVTIVSLLVAASDSFSVWIINNSLGCDVTDGGACFEDNLFLLLSLAPGTGLSALLVIILGLIAILASVTQVVLMVARAGMLVILTGILPLSAAATNTEMGRQWFKKAVAWLAAFILYKPAAAIVYAAAFQLTGTDVFTDDGTGLLAVLTGLMLMVIALFALPALMRFVTPMVGAMTAGSGGGAVAMGAMAAMPTGAIAAGRLAGGGGTGVEHASGPSGAAGSNGSSGASSGGPSGANASAGSSAGGAAAGGAGTSAASGAGAGAAGAGAGAATGGAVAGGATAAGAAGGPVGMAAGAALDVGMKAGQAAAGAARSIGEHGVGEGDGPSGSR